MGDNDLTLREVFNKLMEAQDKFVEVQTAETQALNNLATSVKSIKNQNNKLLFWIAITGWVLAAIGFGIEGIVMLKDLLPFL